MTETEEQHLAEAIKAARTIQDFLWGECNSSWTLEEWKRMFRKRVAKIDDIDPTNPHAMVELRKRLLQNAALSIALLGLMENQSLPTECKIPSNLPQFAVAKYT